MLINGPFPVTMECVNTPDKVWDACCDMMADLGISAASAPSSSSRLTWGNTFCGRAPTLDDLVRVAEAHGYDVLWGINVHGPNEWDAEFVAIEARDPKVCQRYEKLLRRRHAYSTRHFSKVKAS